MSPPFDPFTQPTARSHAPSISCIVPARNEAAHIGQFLRDLHSILLSLSDCYEIIVINDGSTDTTYAEVMKVASQCGVRYLGLSRNFGKEAALSAGVEYAQGEVVILMDADYQHPLQLLPEMLQLWRTGYDMVYGVIANRRHESGHKRLGTNLFYRLMETGSSITIPRNAGDFRLMDQCVVRALRQLPERNRFMKGLYAWVGFKSVALPFTPNERASGQSNFCLRSLSKLALAGMTAFTTLPLRIWSAVGAGISLLAMLYGAYVALETMLFGNTIAGWATLTCGLMFFSGVQLFSIGVLGEYLGRVYEEVKKRPLYLLAQDHNLGHLQARSSQQDNQRLPMS